MAQELGESCAAPVFGAKEPVDLVDQIDLDEIFEECFAQDWQFAGDVPEQDDLLETLDTVLGGAPQIAPALLPKRRGITLPTAPTQPPKKTEKPPRRGATNRADESDSDSEFETTKQRKKRKTKRARKTDEDDEKELTDRQRVERRERNREHAKRSRIRKKFLLESLLEQVSDLRSENKILRSVIRERFPDDAHAVLNECSTEESLLLCAEPSTSPIGPTQQLVEPDFRLMMALQSAQQNFAVSDPSLPDNPIVYASQGFLTLTGYSMHQVIGRNCRFLQGPGTDKKAVDVIREGVTHGVDTSVCLLNYKADGTPFWNQFFVAALRDADGQIVNYVGVQCQVNQVPIAEIKERAKRMALIDL